MFKNPFSFEGRIRRLELGLSVLIFYAYAFIIGIFLAIAGIDAETPLIYILLIPGYWFLWAQGAKRCHDRGNSGWYQLIPFYGLWMLFADSDYGSNDYGLNPKGIGNDNNDNIDEFDDL
ncbi:aminopeptidase [Bacteroidia bacterium]|nr:aminopeptidase [Bacteroidia bacterium]